MDSAVGRLIQQARLGRRPKWSQQFLADELCRIRYETTREQVARIIDGRSPIKLHGPTEMPAWGNIYRAEIDAAAGTRRGVREEDEVNVSYRIQALIEYLASIQEQ